MRVIHYKLITTYLLPIVLVGLCILYWIVYYSSRKKIWRGNKLFKNKVITSIVVLLFTL